MASKWWASAEFKRRLAKLPASVLKKTNEAIKTNAEEWVRDAQSMAPVDPKDGVFLKPSIRHHESETGGQIIRAGGETTTKTMSDGTKGDYAVFQEFGTIDFDANPFFWPAYRFNKKRFGSRRRRAMNKAIKDFN